MAKDGEVSAGRGVLYIGIAKMYFIVATSAVEVLLPRLLGAVVFGAYSFVSGAVSSVNNVMVTGTIQAVSRHTTADASRVDAVKAAGLKMHLLLGLPVAVAFTLIAPLWAHFAHDATKTGPLVLSAGIIACYAFYCVFVGSANGARQFHKQAGLDMTFATMRVGGMVGAAFLGLGLYGVVGAWVAAAGAIMVIASVVVGLPKRGVAPAEPVRPMLRYLAQLAVYLILMNLIMIADAQLLKRLASEWFQAHGSTIEAAAKLADAQVGYYRAVQILARLPYQLMLAVTFVVFPLVSAATFEKDLEKTRGYIRTTNRYSLMAAALMGSVLAANPTALIDIPYQPEYAIVGGPALALLALGHVAFVVFTIAGTVLNSAGRTTDATIAALITLVLLVTGLWIAIPRFQPGQDMLLACAAATSGAMLLGALISGWMLIRRFGAFISPLSVVRIGLAAAACLALPRLVHARSPIMAMGMAVACGVTFLVVLVVTRELRPSELRRRS